MKKRKIQELFFEELRKIPIISVVCEKVNISRNTIYRWRKEDKKFCKKMDEVMEEGVEFVSDMSESQLLNLIKDQHYSAISFWLRTRSPKYKEKIEITSDTDSGILSPSQERTVREALGLGAIYKNKHDRKKDTK